MADRQALASEGRLVELGLVVGEGAVDGHGFARADEQQVADVHVVHVDLGDGVGAAGVGGCHAVRGARGAVEQCADFAAGAGVRIGFERFAAGEHEHDDE